MGKERNNKQRHNQQFHNYCMCEMYCIYCGCLSGMDQLLHVELTLISYISASTLSTTLCTSGVCNVCWWMWLQIAEQACPPTIWCPADHCKHAHHELPNIYIFILNKPQTPPTQLENVSHLQFLHLRTSLLFE